MASFRESVQVYVDRNLAPEARSRLLASAARKVASDLISAGRASPVYDTVVDGSPGVSEDAVKPEGRITYIFSQIGTAALFAVAYLQGVSPSRTGRFRRGWVISVNGRQIPADSIRPDQIPTDAEVFIYNTEGDARKVDVQYVGNKKINYSVPPNALQAAAVATRARFGISVVVKRISSVTFGSQWTIQHGRRAGEAVQTPALVITSR